MNNQKIVLITGATSGIGKETALALAKQGYNINFTSRDKTKGEQTVKEIIASTENSNVKYFDCDLSSFESIKKFSDEFKKQYNVIDILINNAGVWENQRRLTKDGIEMTFGVNHLAPFLLTKLLLDLVKNSTNGKIINLSSALHGGSINFDDIEGKKTWNQLSSYRQSKLCNILFTKKLARILTDTKITVNAVHPGVIKTGLTRGAPSLVKFILGFFLSTPEQGAKTTLHVANLPDSDKTTGEYFAGSKIANSGSYSRDESVADKLWDLSEEYIENI